MQCFGCSCWKVLDPAASGELLLTVGQQLMQAQKNRNVSIKPIKEMETLDVPRVLGRDLLRII